MAANLVLTIKLLVVYKYDYKIALSNHNCCSVAFYILQLSLKALLRSLRDLVRSNSDAKLFKSQT